MGILRFRFLGQRNKGGAYGATFYAIIFYKQGAPSGAF